MPIQPLSLQIGGDNVASFRTIGEIQVNLVYRVFFKDHKGHLILVINGNLTHVDEEIVEIQMDLNLKPAQMQFKLQEPDNTQRYTTREGVPYDITFLAWNVPVPGVFQADFQVSWPD